MSSVSLSDAVQENMPTFEEWTDEQDFDYSRTESKVVDYINDTLDYEKVDGYITEASDINGWEAYFKRCGIEKESGRAETAKKHIRAYVNARSA